MNLCTGYLKKKFLQAVGPWPRSDIHEAEAICSRPRRLKIGLEAEARPPGLTSMVSPYYACGGFIIMQQEVTTSDYRKLGQI